MIYIHHIIWLSKKVTRWLQNKNLTVSIFIRRLSSFENALNQTNGQAIQERLRDTWAARSLQSVVYPILN